MPDVQHPSETALQRKPSGGTNPAALQIRFEQSWIFDLQENPVSQHPSASKMPEHSEFGSVAKNLTSGQVFSLQDIDGGLRH